MNNPNTPVQNVAQPRTTVRNEGRMGYRTRKYPYVIGGVCEWCGILNPDDESYNQYKFCPHYRGMTLECNYCDPTKNMQEVTRISKLYVFDHKSQMGADGLPALAVVCDSFSCNSAFKAEYGG